MRRLDTNLIHGRWTPATGRTVLTRFDPSTETPLHELVCASPEDVDTAVDAARRASASWRRSSPDERSALLRRLAEGLGARSETFAELIAREIGSPLWFGRDFQVPMPIRNLAAMAEALDIMAFEEAAGTSAIWREAGGVVAAITPWNAPLHQIVAKVGAALAAGCTVVLKPSELAPLTVRALVEVFEEAGTPAGAVNVVFGDGETGRALIEHPGVDMVSFTGSVEVGRHVGASAGRALRPVSLELGGKSAAILLRDASFPDAVAGVLRSCFANSGQVCVAQTRMLVHEDDLSGVERLCREGAAQWRVGRPLDPQTRLGPLATSDGRARFCETVSQSLADGARLVCGGAAAPPGLDVGYFVQPTVLAGVDPDMDVARREVFGPLLAIQTYRELDEVIEIADAPGFGLSGAVWSADRDAAVDVARRLRTGQVSINGAPQNYATPFGGVGLSGFGRENGRFGIEGFLRYKAVHGAMASA